MKIELGKTYALSNMYKKSFVEINYYTNGEGKCFQREIGWRSGTMLVTPVYDYEVEEIQTLVDEGENFSGVTTLTDFSETEFCDTWDGCWEDYTTDQDWSEALEEMHDAFYDDEELSDEHFDFGTYMENEHGYDLEESEWFIDGPVTVEESEHTMDVDMTMYEEENA